MFPRHNKVEFIDAKSYPPVVRACDAASFVTLLKGDDAQRRAGRAVLARTSQLRDAVLDYVTGLERAARDGDDAAAFDRAHEIRGLGGTVGLVAAGRIANGLCIYLDVMRRRAQRADGPVVALHVDAIARAAQALDDATRLGEKVALELASLVAHKLGIPLETAAE
ncbi:MAG TPA: Hpt domain-containing protein [Rhizomicrobium sp.]|nr:Hpt domain-containing protein [Rhizomicrobium sp.]